MVDIEPAGDLVARVAKAICCEGYPCSAERDGNICVAIKNWANEARAAIAAMPDRAALVGEVPTREDYKQAALRHRDAWYDMRDERDALATQLAASQADVARLQEVLGVIEAIGDGSKTASSLTNIADIARAAMPGGGPGAWVPADHLAEANREIARLRDEQIYLAEAFAAHREAAVRDMRERAAKEAEDFWGVDSAADRIRALPLGSK